MKKNFFTLFSLFLLFASVSLAQTARIQVIHNSTDAAAQQVDVYLDGTLLLDNFAFRTATPFVNAPAGVEIDLDIAPATSASVAESIFNRKVTLTENETYVTVASGIVSPSGYSPSVPFDLFVYAMGCETASGASNTDVLVFHGSTDAPEVTVFEIGAGAGELFTFEYGEFAGYLELPTADFVLDIRAGGESVVAYSAPLATLGLDGAAHTVLASGFLNPANNSDGPAFGLFVALADGGDLTALPIYTTSSTIITDSNVSLSVYPNPVSNLLNIEFEVARESNVTVEIHSIIGSRIATIYNNRNAMGNINVNSDVSNLPSGMYLVTVTNGQNRTARKIQVINKH